MLRGDWQGGAPAHSMPKESYEYDCAIAFHVELYYTQAPQKYRILSMSMMKTFECKLADSHPMMRLDQFLAGRYAYFSRAQWQRIIRDTQIQVDGKPGAVSQRIGPGSIVTYAPQVDLEPEIDTHFEVLFEDDAIVVVNKPAPCPTTRTGRYLYHTLEHLMENYLQGEVGRDLWVLHRLDIETSGAVLVAKHPEARSKLYEQFATQVIQKSYLCVTKGESPLLQRDQEMPIGMRPGSPIRIKSYPNLHGKRAHTQFLSLGQSGSYHLVRCYLYTGRTHQIRAHLSALNHWIVGDKHYYPDSSLFCRYVSEGLTEADKLSLETPRLMLHAEHLGFFHPITGKWVLIQAPLKADMTKFMTEKGFF